MQITNGSSSCSEAGVWSTRQLSLQPQSCSILLFDLDVDGLQWLYMTAVKSLARARLQVDCPMPSRQPHRKGHQRITMTFGIERRIKEHISKNKT